jgi:hypothetical protein
VKLNLYRIYQVLVYADYASPLGDNIPQNTETLIDACKKLNDISIHIMNVMKGNAVA